MNLAIGAAEQASERWVGATAEERRGGRALTRRTHATTHHQPAPPTASRPAVGPNSHTLRCCSLCAQPRTAPAFRSCSPVSLLSPSARRALRHIIRPSSSLSRASVPQWPPTNQCCSGGLPTLSSPTWKSSGRTSRRSATSRSVHPASHNLPVRFDTPIDPLLLAQKTTTACTNGPSQRTKTSGPTSGHTATSAPRAPTPPSLSPPRPWTRSQNGFPARGSISQTTCSRAATPTRR